MLPEPLRRPVRAQTLARALAHTARARAARNLTLCAHAAARAGFRHSAFTFGAESMVAKSNINGAKIPPGQLVNFVQKGLMYTELERAVGDDGSVQQPSVAPFTLQPTDVKSEAPAEKKTGKKRDREEPPSAPRGASDGGSCEDEQVTTLSGHSSEVFICAWSPTTLQLASGSGDSTARIWQLPDGPCGKAQQGRMDSPRVLTHVSVEKGEKSKDVTTLDWNPDGTCLATGSYDGQARIWTSSGKLTATLSKHKGPIFSLKWSPTGQYLLSGSVDKTAIVWDAATGAVKQQYAFHKEPTLDVDWRDAESFASCSTDRMIYVCKLGQPNYLRCFEGHKDEVNAIRWDPSGQLLASCSDDMTAKLWSMSSSSSSFKHDLVEHSKEIYTVRWSPTGPGTANPGSKLVLATASFDNSIRIWCPSTGKCLHVLDKHRCARQRLARARRGS